ncbi:MAG: GNAT family N-acetyltransferase [Nitrososphaerales archaeon]
MSSIGIRKLPRSRWKDYRNLRLEALKSDPSAFGSSFEEEVTLTEGEWKRRIQNILFATSNDTPVGMIGCVFGDRLKAKHIAEIHGVYVSPGHRGEGIGTKMLGHALQMIRKNKRAVKAELWVNPEQLAAVKLYKKSGFVVSGKSKKSIKVGRMFFDMLLMEKML